MSIPIRPVIQDKTRIELGKRGENEARIIRWTNLLPKWRETYGAGTVVLLHQRLGDTQPYPAAIQVEGDNIDWTVTAADTARAGQGSCELQYIVEDSVVKSKRWQTLVFCSLEEPGPAPEPSGGWVQQMVAQTDAAVAAGLEALQEAGTAGLEELQEARTAGLKELQETAAEGCTALQEGRETALAAVEEARSQAEQQLAGMAQSYSKGESDGRYVPVESALTVSASGDDLVTLSPTVPWTLQGLKLFGRTVQDGVPSPEHPVPLVSAGESGTLTVQVTDGGGERQSLTLQTPNGLPGIPVSSGGNYTDESGQQWICNLFDFKSGTVYIHCKACTISGIPSFVETTDVHGRFIWYNDLPYKFANGEQNALSSFSKFASWGVPHSSGSVFAVNAQGLYYSPPASSQMTGEEVNALFAQMIASENPPMIVAQLATPITEPIDTETMAAYAALQSYWDTTNVICNGCGIQATALADATQYMADLSQRIAALESAQTNL